jgi:L-2-hydroxyglutarate oxidase LhgO
MTERVDAVVVGAGVVGLAVARALAQSGREVLILECANAFGTATSSRSSEVVHAGMYYTSGSLKAQLCVRGRELLYAYCAERGVAHRRLGKLIVATNTAQYSELQRLQATARANGVHDVQWLSGAQASALEPELNCTAALLSPSTGIVDSHALMLSLLGDAENAGATLALNSRVLGLSDIAEDKSLVLSVSSGETAMQLSATTVVNCAGLDACRLAFNAGRAKQDINNYPNAAPTPFYAKGNYFSLRSRAPFSRLVYPVPEPGGLGVHLTLDMGGQARFGPDVEWVQEVEYSVNPARAAAFYSQIRAYWPALPDDSLQPAYSGIRPKIVGPGAPAADFLIQTEAQHGVAGWVNLLGIESPGLTASLALAEVVAALPCCQ